MAVRVSNTRVLIPADLTKLDGIEALADVTDAANVAAAGAVMDADFAGATLGRMTRTGVGTYAVVQDNLAAAVDPVVGDDVAAGYGVDSIWINTTAVPRRIFKCLNPAAGAAVWRQFNAQNNLAAAVAPTVAADVTLGYDVNSVWLDTTANVAYICLNPAVGAAVWQRLGAREQHENNQLAAASEDLRVIRALVPGRIVAVAAETRIAAAAGESMTFDVTVGGVSILTAPITIDVATPANTPVAGALIATPTFAAGDEIAVARVYVAGGGPTPMTTTSCGILLQYN